LLVAAITLSRPAIAAPEGMDAATESKLKAVLTGPQRSAENRARDQYRHPLETLKFFGLAQNMTVLEISPAGGWYTEILAPLLKGSGHYIAALGDPTASEEAAKAAAVFKQKFGAETTFGHVEIGILDAKNGKLAPVPPGTVDMVLTFRNLHNWIAQGTAAAMFKSFYAVLKPGGWLGIADHRASAAVPQDPKASTGYVREDYAVGLATEAGFRFVAKSEINANPKDTKDHPNGVWSLPPTYRGGDTGRAAFAAVGESDRFTMLFQKP
jgi:predicted methyltransferase